MIYNRIAGIIKDMVAPIGHSQQMKVSIVLDKEDVTNLDRAYIIVMAKDESNSDKRWKFVYRSKMNSLELVPYHKKVYDGIFKVRKVVRYRIALKYNSEEYDRFTNFLINNITYRQTLASFNEASRFATIKYLKASNKSELVQFV